MTEKTTTGFGVLVLSALVGISLSGSYLSLFNSVIPFSVFPIITLVLSVYCLYQKYVSEVMPEGVGALVLATCLLGLFGYITVIMVEYNDLGSNMIPTLICLGLLFWIMAKYNKLKPV